MDDSIKNKLFVFSKELNDRIKYFSNVISSKTEGVVTFEEFIALPYFGGNVILRFNLNKDNVSLDDLNKYEQLMYEIVGDEFLVDFMGSVYKKVGADYSHIEEIYVSFKNKFSNVSIKESPFSKNIKNDGEILLESNSLSKKLKVWEIQIEDPLYMIVLGNEKKILKKSKDIEIYQISEEPCMGLIKAAFYAKENQVSLAYLMINEEKHL